MFLPLHVKKEKFRMVFLLWLVLGFFLPSFSYARESVRIAFIADGDTVRLDDRRWVRLSGIDTPERMSEDGGSCAGELARQKLLELLDEGQIFLEEKGKDRYGRILGHLYLPDGTCVNDEMIRQGMAWVLLERKPGSLEKKRISLQQEAIRKESGIWAKLPEKTAAVLGNRNSYRFHALDCEQARKISPRNRVRFISFKEAFLQGYSPARECIVDPVCPVGF